MDTAEEPQKKIFKARKTMKASDRQQLEAVHKAKEDLLKPTEQKLVNGIHENGTLDVNYTNNDKEPMEDKHNVNGILGIDHDSLEFPFVKLTDLREGLKHVNHTGELKLALNLELNESTVCPEDGDKVGPTEAVVQTCSTKLEQEEMLSQGSIKQEDTNERFLEDQSLQPEFSEEQTQSDIPSEERSCSALEEKSLFDDEPLVEEPIVRDSGNDLMDVISESPIAKAENEMEESDIIKEPLELETLDSADLADKDDLLDEEQENDESNELHNAIQNIPETEGPAEEQESTELLNGSQDKNVSPDVAENGSEGKMEVQEMEREQNGIGDELISSSSMEVDQNPKNLEQSSCLTAEAPSDKSLSDIQTESVIENAEEMETDEIIPILEKLAPVEDAQGFTESKADFETVPDKEEENEESLADSPTKVTSETLPVEAFLVLSDEEEPSGEGAAPKDNMETDQAADNVAENVTDNVAGNVTDNVAENVADNVAENVADNVAENVTDNVAESVKDVIEVPEEKADDEHKEPENKDEPQAERSEISRRKRSKSEDLDSQCLKRRRFDGEEYEAELKVKITAGDDLNEKLQKVIQRMFEEKLSALKCLDFDKAISELRSRVEKIEGKKHETALHSMQAKITRLTKRFGAAKEDLKKRPEVPANQPASPAKSALNDSVPNTNMVNFRNAGTVRQMLETKRGVGDTAPVNVQTSTATVSSAPGSSNVTLRSSNTTQAPMNHSPANSALQTRPAPDWKLIQQKINASSIGTSQTTLSNPSKPIPPVTSAPVMTSVLPAPTTATVVGNTQVSTSNTQPVSVSLQSLPVILHVPVAVPSQSQLLQGATGTLVTNQQSGNVEFIQVQNQSTVNSLTKTPVSLPVAKAMNSPSIPSSGIQRNTSASSVNSSMAVQALPTSHSVTLSSRQSLPSVGTPGVYNQTSNRNTAQLKSTLPTYNNSTTTESPSGNRPDLQINRTQTAETASNKRNSVDSSVMGGKPAASVIDLTLDEEEAELSTRDSRRGNSSSMPASVQSTPTQPMSRQLQPLQANSVQTSTASLPSQATIHVLPTAQTTVNITQRPGIQTAPRAAAPRASNNPHMAYTTTTLPPVPIQTPIRNTVMQNQNLRQITPQTGGVPVRMPQTAYVVNNGMPVGSTGPQLTVHHRPPQEPARPIHPAPLPDAPQPQRLPPEAASTSPPQKPHLKLARVQSQNGIVLSWSVLEVDRTCAIVDSYHLYAYHEDPTATSSSQWKKIGEVKALPLPMACTLTQFVSGSKYYFAVRAKDIYGRFGPFCDPQSTDVISTQNS